MDIEFPIRVSSVLSDVFPASWTTAAVTTGITDFLGNAIVLGVTMLIFGLALAPRAVRALKRAVGVR